MGSAFSLTPLTDSADELARKLDGRLDHGTATELHSLVLIEHHRLSQQALEQCVKTALARIYGDGWRNAIEGLD